MIANLSPIYRLVNMRSLDAYFSTIIFYVVHRRHPAGLLLYWLTITSAIERELVPPEQMGRWLGINRFFKRMPLLISIPETLHAHLKSDADA
jgi:hypothetical protein